MQKLLKITYIGEMEEAKNGRKYRVIRFKPNNILEDGTPIFSNQGEGTRTIWEEFTDKDGNVFKEDGLYTSVREGKAKVGGLVGGQIVKVSTTPYQIPESDFQATSYTCVVFDHEILIDYVNRQLKSVYACMLLGDNLTAPDQLNRPTSAEPVTTSAPVTTVPTP